MGTRRTKEVKREFTKKTISKLCSYLLSAAIVVGGLTISPLETMEVYAATAKNVNLNVSNSIAGLVTKSGYSGNSTIYYASNKDNTTYPWKIVASSSDILTLFSTGFIGSNHKYDSEKHRNWSGSDICKYLNGSDTHTVDGILPTYFTETEKSDVAISAYGNTETTNTCSINISQKLVLPSVEEVKDGGTWRLNDGTRGVSGYWWLRSPNNRLDISAIYVNSIGFVDLDGHGVSQLHGVRPAFNLNLSSILFSSASGTDKTNAFAVAADNSANTWKLTLKDGNTGFKAMRTSTGNLTEDSDVTVKVTDLGTEGIDVDYTQISAMLLDSENTVLAYGKISGGEGLKTGEYTFKIPSGVTTASKLYVFAEDVKSSASVNLTDYASNMADVTTYNTTPANPSPSNQGDNNDDNSSENNNQQLSNNQKSTDTYVNPLVWNYVANQPGSRCLIEKQGPACTKTFKMATPAGYTEAFSFNLLLNETGSFKPTFTKKTGKFVLNILREYQKPGRTFALIGIDKNGNTRIFTDEDLSDDTITTTLDIEGYAFSLIYSDTAVIPAIGTSGTSGTYIVQKGDTLSEIASQLGKKRADLIQKNNLNNPDQLKIGQKINY